MKLINKTLTLFFLLLQNTASFAQLNNYSFKRELTGVKEKWHKVILPEDIFKHTSSDLNDIRLIGITSGRDTLEVPYILKKTIETNTVKEAICNIINRSKNDQGYFFTFEIPKQNTINELILDFEHQNFDWKISVEGSQDQKQWFNILKNYRILSVNNNYTDYKFTKVNFEPSKFTYYRLHINSNMQPELKSIKVLLNETTKGKYKNYQVAEIKTIDLKENKTTAIDISMQSHVPVSKVIFHIKNKSDYYRPVSIEYISDSVKTEKGWYFNYRTLATGILSSIDKNELTFDDTPIKKLKITIKNFDNSPLQIDSITVCGYVYELTAYFADPSFKYFLLYGNSNAQKPIYDLERFAEKIPVNTPAIQLNNEEPVVNYANLQQKPLFENKVWLWGIMVLMISLLGWFAIKMMKKQDTQL